MTIEFKLPELGEGVDTADVARILVSEGDEIQANQNVLELETEKAVADLPCPHAGKVTNVQVAVGDTVHVGQTIFTLEETTAEKPTESDDDSEKEKSAPVRKKDQKGERLAKKKKADASAADDDSRKEESGVDEQSETTSASKSDSAAKKTKRDETEEQEQQEPKEVSESSKEKPIPSRSSDKPRRTSTFTAGNGRHQVPTPAGPATRRLARDLGVDLESLRPEEGGRITPEDVAHVYAETQKAAALTSSTKPLPDFDRFGPTERRRLSSVARTTALRLAASWNVIPHVTQHGLADITELEVARQNFVQTIKEGESAPNLTLTAIAIKAVISALRHFPQFNSSFDSDKQELVLKHFFHIGVAVDTERGLMVPVIRDADRMDMLQIAQAISELADRARNRKLSREDMVGGTFTISNQGGIGGSEFTPIVNWPEVAILGLARARKQLEMVDGDPRERLKLPLSLSYDHRVLNGADAARFIDYLERILAGSFELLVAS